TCADLGFNCGMAGDGCGGMLMCGMCTGMDTCGGNGIPNVCGHVTLDSDMTHTPYTSGAFAQQFPDQNNMCQVSGLAATAEQDLGSVPSGSPVLPQDKVTYSWSNFNVYVTAADQGTQFAADMTYTENGCTANYHVVGVWPTVSCTDDNGMPSQDMCNPC